MVTFVPSVWKTEGDGLTVAADDFYRAAQGVIVAEAITARTASPVEAAVVASDALCYNPWHHLIANGFESLTAVSSRMVGTGSDYAATEDDAEAAGRRFW